MSQMARAKRGVIARILRLAALLFRFFTDLQGRLAKNQKKQSPPPGLPQHFVRLW